MTEDPQHYTEISRRSDLPTGSASIFPASRLDHPHAQVVQVELRPFNDRALNRDLAILCERVNQVSLRLPDERRLSSTIRQTCCILTAQKVAKYRDSLLMPPM